MTAPARIRLLRDADNPWYEMILIEGRNREIRKMFEEIGHHVEKIRRVGYGPLVLDVEPGRHRELTLEEVAHLRRAAEGKSLRPAPEADSRKRRRSAPRPSRPANSSLSPGARNKRRQRRPSVPYPCTLYPVFMAKATFAAGCFWGVEARFQQLPGVLSTAVGYEGGQLTIPRITTSVPTAPATPKPSRSTTIPRKSPTIASSRSSSPSTIPRRSTARARLGRSVSQRRLLPFPRAGSRRASPYRPPHRRKSFRAHRHPCRPRRDLLARRRIPPAIPRKTWRLICHFRNPAVPREKPHNSIRAAIVFLSAVRYPLYAAVLTRSAAPEPPLSPQYRQKASTPLTCEATVIAARACGTRVTGSTTQFMTRETAAP